MHEKYEIVFDAVGKISKDESKHLLTQDGTFVTVGGLDVVKERASDLEMLATLYDEGSFNAVIDRTYALDEIVEANRYVDTGHKKGSVAITISKQL